MIPAAALECQREVKRDCAASNRLKAAQPDSLQRSPKQSSGEVWQFHMYTQELPICIPESRWRSAHPGRHSISFHKSRLFPCGSGAVPFGFWYGGFSSTAGYVPGNEASLSETLRPQQAKRLSLPRGCTFPRGATRFYPGAQEDFAALSSKPFGFSAGCQSGWTAACPSPQALRHRNARLSPRWSRRP